MYCVSYYCYFSGPGSSVGIANDYGLDGPNPGEDEIFRTCPDRPWGPPSLLYNEYRFFAGVKYGRGVALTPHPLLVPRSWKSRAIPPPTLLGLNRACNVETLPLLLLLLLLLLLYVLSYEFS